MRKVNPNQSLVSNVKTNQSGSGVTVNASAVTKSIEQHSQQNQQQSQSQTQHSTSSVGNTTVNLGGTANSQAHRKNSKSQNPNQVFKTIKYNNLKASSIKKISEPITLKQSNVQAAHYNSIGNSEMQHQHSEQSNSTVIKQSS